MPRTESRPAYYDIDLVSDRYYTPPAVKTFTAEEDEFIQAHVLRYLCPTRPTVVAVYRELCEVVRQENEQRLKNGIPAIRSPSPSTFQRRIAALQERVVRNSRHGRKH